MKKNGINGGPLKGAITAPVLVFLIMVLVRPAAASLLPDPSAQSRELLFTYGYYNLTIDPLDSSRSATLRPCQKLQLRLTQGMNETDFGTVVASEVGCNIGMLPNEATTYEPDSAGNERGKSTSTKNIGVYTFPLTIYTGVEFIPLKKKYFYAGMAAGLGMGVEPYPLLYTYLRPALTAVLVPKLLTFHFEMTFIPKSPTYQKDLRNSVTEWQSLFTVTPPRYSFDVVIGFFFKQWRNESKVENVYRAYGLSLGANFNTRSAVK